MTYLLILMIMFGLSMIVFMSADISFGLDLEKEIFILFALTMTSAFLLSALMILKELRGIT